MNKINLNLLKNKKSFKNMSSPNIMIYELTINCLKNTFCYSDPETRKFSEEKLKELSEDTITHVNIILNGLKNDTTINSKQLKI